MEAIAITIITLEAIATRNKKLLVTKRYDNHFPDTQGCRMVTLLLSRRADPCGLNRLGVVLACFAVYRIIGASGRNRLPDYESQWLVKA